MKTIALLLTAFLLQSPSTRSPAPIKQNDVAVAIAQQALRDTRALHPGMKRKDVEKKFIQASFTTNVETVYTYAQCQEIHIVVRFNQPNDFSPEDTIISVSRPYLDDVTAD